MSSLKGILCGKQFNENIQRRTEETLKENKTHHCYIACLLFWQNKEHEMRVRNKAGHSRSCDNQICSETKRLGCSSA